MTERVEREGRWCRGGGRAAKLGEIAADLAAAVVVAASVDSCYKAVAI
jgi:hypothetical protein